MLLLMSCLKLSLCLSADRMVVQSVGDWLAVLELSEYENTLVGNGYDDMDFVVCLDWLIELYDSCVAFVFI